MKGKFNEFDASGSNRQNKINQYKAIAISASIFILFTAQALYRITLLEVL